jgi:hypothetical protein
MTAVLPSGYHASFRRRVIQDAYAEASAAQWRRRAATFEWARPRRGDYPGHASRADLAARDRRLAAIAEACRNRAQLALIPEVGPR